MILKMSYNETSSKLAGPIGLLKQYVECCCLLLSSCSLNVLRFVTRTGRETAEGGSEILYFDDKLITLDYTDATQVFGGRALTTTGMGRLIENVGPANFLV
jgi:hypothetical protein